ncbi:MAG: hypothetical protein E7503_04090 [Ruminococcus sp.]|nr:hypothetical protein [Ruminococcus sp.]
MKSTECSHCCRTRYPILLLHGMGFHDRHPIHYYWGRIPRLLRMHGATVYLSGQDGNAITADNAQALVSVIEQILKETKAEKVNIIAHSKGGLEARYLVSTLGMGHCIASVTTLSTPHHGSRTIDWLLPRFAPIIKAGCGVFDSFRRLMGDRKPYTYRVICELTSAHMRKFNKENPDDPRVFYRSYAFVMKNPFSDMIMAVPNAVVYLFEGENDGLLTPANAKWTNFRGVYRSVARRGISHPDVTDYRRLPFRLYQPKRPKTLSDITVLYLAMVRELRLKGL